MRSTLKCSPNWDENCKLVYDTLEFYISTLRDVRLTLKWSLNMGEFRKYGNNVLEFTTPTFHNVCMTLRHPKNSSENYEGMNGENDVLILINLMLHDMREHSPVLGGLREVVYCGKGTLRFSLNHTRKWDGITYGGYYEYKRFESFLLWSEKYMTFRACYRRNNINKKNKKKDIPINLIICIYIVLY